MCSDNYIRRRRQIWKLFGLRLWMKSQKCVFSNCAVTLFSVLSSILVFFKIISIDTNHSLDIQDGMIEWVPLSINAPWYVKSTPTLFVMANWNQWETRNKSSWIWRICFTLFPRISLYQYNKRNKSPFNLKFQPVFNDIFVHFGCLGWI